MPIPGQGLLLVSVFAAAGCGMMAGLFFVFSNAVMPSLAQQAPASAVRTMQTINLRIVNPVFLGVFLGTALGCAAVAADALGDLTRPGAAWALAGAAAYLVGTFGTTLACNVPLNNRLASLDADSEDAARYWPIYVSHWTAWNHARAVAAVLGTALLIVATRQLPVS